jgi:hypothetical protein
VKLTNQVAQIHSSSRTHSEKMAGQAQDLYGERLFLYKYFQLAPQKEIFHSE